MFMVTQHLRPAAVAAPSVLTAAVGAPFAHFMWTPSPVVHLVGKLAEGLVYIVSQPNVTITKITGYNEAA